MTLEQEKKINKIMLWSFIAIPICWVVGQIIGNESLWAIPLVIYIGVIVFTRIVFDNEK